MDDKNTKLTAAARLGRKIDFWAWMERMSMKIDRLSKHKLSKYRLAQDELLLEILNDERNKT